MDYTELRLLHRDLERVRDDIDASPDRHESTVKGYLADRDWNDLLQAGAVVHRLMLWRQYAEQSPASYLAEPARLYVYDLESDDAPHLVGRYLRTEEGTVLYIDAFGDVKHAPADCVRVGSLEVVE